MRSALALLLLLRSAAPAFAAPLEQAVSDAQVRWDGAGRGSAERGGASRALEARSAEDEAGTPAAPRRPPRQAPPPPGPSDAQVMEAILRSGSLPELRTRLSATGAEFPDLVSLTRFLQIFWAAQRLSQIEALASSPPPAVSGLPTLRVRAGPVEFLLHGVVHGEPGESEPTRGLRAFVAETAKSYCDEPGERFLFEENLGTWFGLTCGTELKDHESAVTVAVARQRESVTGAARIGVMLGIGAVYQLKERLRGFFSRSKESADPASAALDAERRARAAEQAVDLKAVADPRYQELSARLEALTKLPEPIDLSLQQVQESYFSSFTWFKDGSHATAEERSRYMADELRSAAARDRAVTVHFLCGMDHVSQIAYFLSVPPAVADSLFDSLK